MTLWESRMTISVLKYTWKITATIRYAKRQGAISQHEADYLHGMVENSSPASSTWTLVIDKGVPDFLYAALYFSTLIWRSADAAERDCEAQAGYKLALFALRRETPAHDPYWAAKLLQELYDSHAESVQFAPGNAN